MKERLCFGSQTGEREIASFHDCILRKPARKALLILIPFFALKGDSVWHGRDGALGRLFFLSTPRRLSEAANSPRSSASQNERKSANSSKGNRPTTDSFNSSCSKPGLRVRFYPALGSGTIASDSIPMESSLQLVGTYASEAIANSILSLMVELLRSSLLPPPCSLFIKLAIPIVMEAKGCYRLEFL